GGAWGAAGPGGHRGTSPVAAAATAVACSAVARSPLVSVPQIHPTWPRRQGQRNLVAERVHPTLRGRQYSEWRDRRSPTSASWRLATTWQARSVACSSRT